MAGPGSDEDAGLVRPRPTGRHPRHGGGVRRHPGLKLYRHQPTYPPAASGGIGSPPAQCRHSRATLTSPLSSLNDKLEQLLHLHAAASRRQGAGGDTSDDDEDADHELFVRITDVMSPPPPEALIQRRRDEGSCLACGENHKWRQCPKITGDPTLAARLREGIQRDRDRRQSGRRRS